MPDHAPVGTLHRSTVLRTTHSLGERERGIVAEAVFDAAPDWSVELCGADSPDCCLLVMPEAADDMLGPTFIIHAAQGTVRLDQLRFDELEPLAERADLAEIIQILRGRLAHLSLMALPVSGTMH